MATTATNGLSSGTGFKVNEIRSATDEDFQHFIRLVEEHKVEGSGWTKKLDKNNIVIWQKETGASPIKMALIMGEFKDVSADTFFDTILDGSYRRTWDENMIDDFDICRLDDNNDVGYYSMKCPGPMKNRDFVNQRSWKVYGSNQLVVFNHSVTVKDLPPSKKFVRGISYITGFLFRSTENGCFTSYITQSDIKGNIPSWIINLTINKIAPSIFRKLYMAASKYEAWKSENDPGFKPWRYPEQNSLKIVEPSSLLPSSLEDTQQAVEEEETDGPLAEDQFKEFVEQITEELDQEVQTEDQIQHIANGH